MDYVVIDGDMAIFQPSFGAATVVVAPGTITGSGPGSVGGKALCIVGDESSVSVPGCMYTAGAYVIPGTGTLEIDSLAGDQEAQKLTADGTAVILVGGDFTAKFTVQSPAQQPTAGGPVPDSTPDYSGSGSFSTSNSKLQGV